jgi:hypothetical protein
MLEANIDRTILVLQDPARKRSMFLMLALKECSVGNILALPISSIASRMFLLQGMVPSTPYTALDILAVEVDVGFRSWMNLLRSARGIIKSLNCMFLLFADLFEKPMISQQVLPDFETTHQNILYAAWEE